MTTETSLHDHLAEARDRLAKVRSAVAEAKIRADATETARLAAERLYIDGAADAMLAGKSTPAKSAELVRLQNADDIADAALDLLRQRVSECEGAVSDAADVYLRHEARELADLRATQVTTAVHQIIPAFEVLSRAVGVPEARAMIEEIMGHGTWAAVDVEHHRDVLRVASSTPEMAGAEVVLRDFENQTVRPRRATVGDIVAAFVRSH